MTPQASFLYAAAILPERKEELRRVLTGMNRLPGVVDPWNAVIPFARFNMLHFARLLTVSDICEADRAVYGLPLHTLPDYLVFLGEIDGPERAFRAKLIRHAEAGVRLLFSHCRGFEDTGDLAAWLGNRGVAPIAEYVNWVGRTVQQVGEEDRLRQALNCYIGMNAPALRAMRPERVHAVLRAHVAEEQRSGRLELTPQPRTPLIWRLRNLAHMIFVPLALLLASPALLLSLPFFLFVLRRRERSDPEVAPPVDPAHAAELAAIENHDVSNQFSVFGSLKPGAFRRWSMRFFLLLTNYAARHLYTRGGLGRVSTIHFARWVPFDGDQRMLFSSIYDGSLESYMDDFINKVGFGLNVTFSGGIGYPRTRWLLLDGCKDEQVFKRVLRRHQLPTEVWWSAHPGLSAADKHRNGLIRDGITRPSMLTADAGEWLKLF